MVLDSGDYPGCMKAALDAAGLGRFSRPAQGGGGFSGSRAASDLPISSREPGAGRSNPPPSPIDPSGTVLGRIRRRCDGPGDPDHARRHRRPRRSAATAIWFRVTAGDTGAIALGIGGFNSRQAVTAGSSAFNAARSGSRQGARRRRGPSPGGGARRISRSSSGDGPGTRRARSTASRSAGSPETVAGTPGVTLPAGDRARPRGRREHRARRHAVCQRQRGRGGGDRPRDRACGASSGSRSRTIAGAS